MNIALLGYGKMGKAIEYYCLQHSNHKIITKIDQVNAEQLSVELLANADVAIDFSHPDVAEKHIKTCFDAGVPVVCGTTGWLNNWDTILSLREAKNGGLFYSSNFSIGVNLFWQMITHAAQLINEQGYNITIDETHHIHKIDAPSGTAITTAEKIITQSKKYNGWLLDNNNDQNKLPIFAHREGEVPGTHLVTFANAVDEISIAHKAKSRIGFVTGAVKAAEFMVGKTGVYEMNDLLNF